MPRLPDIDYGNPVQSTTQTAAVPYEEASKLAGVMAEGIAAYSQARLKSQMDEAAVTVAEDLAKAEQVLKAKKTLTVKEIKETLGGDVPEHVAEKIADRADEDTVETFDVGDALYAHAAKKSIEAASKRIDGAGWQTDFKERIAGHVQQKKAALASYHLGEMDDYLQAKDLEVADRLVNAGDFDAASQKVVDSVALKGASKVKALAGIETARQLAPANAALSSTDPAAIQAEVARLQTDERARKAIPEARRMEIVGQLKSRGLVFEAHAAATEILGRWVKDPATAIARPPNPEEVQQRLDALPPEVGAKARDIIRERQADAKAASDRVEATLRGELLNEIEKGTIRNASQLELRPAFGKLEARDKEQAARIRAYLQSQISQSRAQAQQGRALGYAERKAQADVDAQAETWFEQVIQTDPTQAANLNVLDVLVNSATPGSPIPSPQAIKRITARQTGVVNGVKRDGGVSESAFHGEVLRLGGPLVEDKTAFVAALSRRRAEWIGKQTDKTKLPSDAEVQGWVASELEWGDSTGGGISRNRRRYQNPTGEPFVPFGPSDQDYVPPAPGAPQAPAALPAPPGRRRAAPAAAPVPRAAGPVRVKTRAEALALPPGTRFVDPAGVERVR